MIWPGLRPRARTAIGLAIIVAVIAASFAGGAAYGRRTAPSAAPPESTATANVDGEVDPDAPEDSATPTARPPADLGRTFDVFWEAWNFVEKDYFRQPVDRQRLVQGAIRGMLNSLNDQYAAYQDPVTTRIEKANQDGIFEGIGAQLEIRDKRIVILAPVEDGPAAKAGLHTGDILLKVDGREVGNLTLGEAAALLRGPSGSKVKVAVQRLEDPEGHLTEMELVRTRIELETVSSRMAAEGIGYVRVRVFGSQTLPQLQRSLRDMRARRVRGLIVDLRDNPGGYLSGAVDVSSQFLREGSVVVYEDRDGKRRPVVAKPGGLATDLTLAVLVNRGSASASEIVAGALRDHNRAVLIGETTFGKGSVQVAHDLSDGSSVKVTVGSWLTPAGRAIQGQGLLPTIEVRQTPEDDRNKRDAIYEKALEWYRAAPTPAPEASAGTAGASDTAGTPTAPAAPAATPASS